MWKKAGVLCAAMLAAAAFTSTADARNGHGVGGAGFSGARVGGAGFSGAHVSGARVGGAYMGGARVGGAYMGGARVAGARVGAPTWVRVLPARVSRAARGKVVTGKAASGPATGRWPVAWRPLARTLLAVLCGGGCRDRLGRVLRRLL